MRISEKQDMISGMGFIGERTGVYKMGPNTKTLAVSGTPPLVLENGKNKPLKGLRLYGKSTQAATPSLESPQEIVSTGMKWSTGKNLLRYPFYSKDSTTSGITWKTYNCHVTGKGITSKGTSFTFFADTMSPGSYGIKANGTLIGMTLRVYDNTDKRSLNPTNFTVEEGHVIYLYINQGFSEVNVDVDIDIVLAKAEDIDSTPFEPYTNGVKELYGDAVSVMVRGKNLLDVKLLNDINNFDKSYSSSGYAFFDMQVKADTDITVSIGQTYSSGDHFLKVSAEKGATVAGTWMCHGTVKLTDKATIPAAKNKGHVYLYFSNTAAKIQKVLENIGYIQVEYGDKATAYEPYHEPQSLSIRTPNGLPGLPVNSGGNYTDADGQQWIADCIDFGRGKYVQNVWVAEFNGSENWILYAPYQSFALECLNDRCYRRSGFSNNLKVETNASVSQREALWIGLDNEYMYVKNSRVYDASLEDGGLSEWKKYLSEHPMTVMTYLDEPIERDLSAEEIAAYKSLKTYKGTTVVESDCYIDIKYNT